MNKHQEFLKLYKNKVEKETKFNKFIEISLTISTIIAWLYIIDVPYAKIFYIPAALIYIILSIIYYINKKKKDKELDLVLDELYSEIKKY